ncbi:DUF4271 domain-containing protein [Maribacter sp. 2304DJ31-5]|uniref:DUF4271 domain-containing protein n=1 Tax=Maribacter sp. 2304DJ31-5 TaxID=3386273 RepID=UPI0039BD50B6
MDPIARATYTSDWITLIIFGSLLFVLLAKLFFYPRFLNFIILPLNNKYIFMYNKKEKLFNWFHIFFTIFQLLNSSLFIFLARRAFVGMEDQDHLFLFPMILLGLFLFICLKGFFQLGNGFIFGSSQIFSELIFKKISYLNYGGIVLFIANIILTYVLVHSKIVTLVAFLLFIIVNVIGWVTVIKNYQKFVMNYFFYFILYLCALEIAPLIIVGNFLK